MATVHETLRSLMSRMANTEDQKEFETLSARYMDIADKAGFDADPSEFTTNDEPIVVFKYTPSCGRYEEFDWPRITLTAEGGVRFGRSDMAMDDEHWLEETVQEALSKEV